MPKIEPFLLEVAEVVNTTLDLDTLLKRVAEIVRRVIDYEIFAILLLNERTQELYIRFAVGHSQDVIDRTRIKVGEGVTGLAAQRREGVLVTDIAHDRHYIEGVPGVRSELAVPLIVRNRVIGVIDIEAPQKAYFTEQHKQLLSLIASRIAVGVENARLYTRVSRQARSLTLLNEISRDLTSILNLDQLLKRIGEQLKRLIDYQMFSILLLDRTATKLEHRFSLRFDENIHIKHDIPLGKGLVGYAAKHNEAVLVPDVTVDERYIALNPETRSELCVPLVYKDEVIGVLDIEHTRIGYFTENHLRTMTTLAAQVAIAIANAQLYEKVTRHEQRMQRDLALARELQRRIMPLCYPPMNNADICAHFSPAHFIGGDLYDFVQYSPDHRKCCKTGLAIGDVSGKGAPAAIYAALVSGFLRSHAVAEPGAAEMLQRINTSLTERPIEAQYVSMIYGLWDDERRVLRIANSGLPRPIYCHNGLVETVEAAGLPIGLFPNPEYDEVTYHAHEGDLFVFFSDGIVDASNIYGHMLGRSAIERVVAANCDGSAADVVDAIFAMVANHRAGVDPFDDETVVALKVRKLVPKKK
ncbi:MAG TPA: GAF domain-containing protein [Terriglobales bacterium]|nr:GAF domain-containing protein [Terriglobales bacterium]